MRDSSSSSKPLRNMTVLLACSEKKISKLSEGIDAMGGKALPFPTIEARDIEDKRLLDQSLASWNEYAWIIFTSAYGVSFCIKRLNELGIPIDSKSIPRICAIGPATAREAQMLGFNVELIPQDFVAEGVIEALSKFHGGLGNLAGCRILIPRAKEARELLPEALAKAGVLVDVAPCYQTVQSEPDESILRQIREKAPDLIVFASSSGIKHLMDIIGENAGKEMLQHSTLAVIGPITAKTAESFGKNPEILPRENTIASLLEAIREHYLVQ